MKNLVIRTVFTLTLLLTLVAILGGVNPVSAHAASLSSTTTVRPFDDIKRVGCDQGFFKIYTDFGKNVDCFDGTGTIDVTLFNIDHACMGSFHNYVGILWQDDGRDQAETDLRRTNPPRADAPDEPCFSIDNGNYVNKVLSITLY